MTSTLNALMIFVRKQLKNQREIGDLRFKAWQINLKLIESVKLCKNFFSLLDSMEFGNVAHA